MTSPDKAASPAPCIWCEVSTRNLRRATGDPNVEATCTDHAVYASAPDNTEIPLQCAPPWTLAPANTDSPGSP